MCKINATEMSKSSPSNKAYTEDSHGRSKTYAAPQLSQNYLRPSHH